MRFWSFMQRRVPFILLVIIAALAGALAYLFILFQTNNVELELAHSESASSSVMYKGYIRHLREQLALATSALQEEQLRTTEFQAQIHGIQGTVNQIAKTNATDRELLQKYSKVFFLNENYVPARLSPIDVALVNDESKVLVFHTDALPFLKRMFASANAAGVHLEIISSYRSFGEQATLKSGYTFTYGSGANSFSADQGYSEHQLGTTIDLTTEELGSSFVKFDSTDAYEWLTAHAHEFGFVLSYPEDNQYYQFEPWHWRFIGTALAKRLFDEKQHFYDLEQRDIDQYRGLIFD